jgi:hypothetical protein
MASELQVTVRGSLSARQVVDHLTGLVRLLAFAEDAELRRDRAPGDRSLWGFTHLAAGSVSSKVAALEPRGGSDWSALDRVPLRLVDGFEHMETSHGLPERWDERTARTALKLAQPLGPTAERGMHLALIQGGDVTRKVEVTYRAAVNLKQATSTPRRSIGSLVGVLQTVSTRRGRTAGLWTQRNNRRVTVTLTDEQLADIGSWLNHRVRVFGELHRNTDGQPLSVRAKRITPLESERRLADSGGIAAGFLEGRSPDEYLEAAGGWS